MAASHFHSGIVAEWTYITIGFAGRTAAEFFDTLNGAGIGALVDVATQQPLRNSAGFTKRTDLALLLARNSARRSISMSRSWPPPRSWLDTYKKQKGTWADYARAFLDLMKARPDRGRSRPASCSPSRRSCYASERTADRCTGG